MVTFSAHWCGPCKASHPALQALAREQTQPVLAIAYESDLGDALQEFRVRAFPTHILFAQSNERQRVEGANVERVRSELVAHIVSAPCMPVIGGATLGGGGSGASSTAPLSPSEARAARLAKLTTAAPPSSDPAAATTTKPTASTATAMDTDDLPKAEPPKDADGDVEMEQDNNGESASTTEDPCAKLDPDLLRTLTESMGFALLRAQKGLLYGTGGTVEGAVEWLMEHQDDVDIDAPVAAVVAQSYKCNECGKILSNMANLELHANKTGHSDFEESTVRVQPLTEEEKVAKIAEIKVRIHELVLVLSLSVQFLIMFQCCFSCVGRTVATLEGQTRRARRSRKGR